MDLCLLINFCFVFFLHSIDNEAFIKYERLGNNEVLLHHTEVPEQFRNTGIAKELATVNIFSILVFQKINFNLFFQNKIGSI